MESDAEFIARMSTLSARHKIRGAAEDSTSAVVNLQRANDWLELENKRLKAAVQWRPIETAPEKPMRVLLFFPDNYRAEWDGADYGITIGFFADGQWRDQGTNHDCFEEWRNHPTHWQPLPPPPEDKP